MNIDEFMGTYDIKPIATFDAIREDKKWVRIESPSGTLLINAWFLDGDKPHLCVDVHAFDRYGEPARTGVFGMENGFRWTFEGDEAEQNKLPTFGTSHGWPATHLVTLLLGAQAERGA